jgi:uncharacterized iron-regulated membrane protein
MGAAFRARMNWLHTWAGVGLGGILFAIFWMGTLAVFDREIDRWMMPATRLAAPDEAISLDDMWARYSPPPGSPQWSMNMPVDRVPVLRISYRQPSGRFISHQHDPATGGTLPPAETLGGTGFIYPFHYMLHLRAWSLGYWLVGLAGMAMLALCVSGVIVHHKIFADFFTFRAASKPRRLILDLHNLAGVLGLPFHLAIALSGLIIFYPIFFPSAWRAVYPDQRTFNADTLGTWSRPASSGSAGLASLDAMAVEARRLWDGRGPFFLRIWHPESSNSFVEFRRSYDDGVGLNTDAIYFDGATGRVLHQYAEPRPVMSAYRFIVGLHFIQFRHWTLRWLYFALGLGGCVLIATGYLFWLAARRKKHAQLGLRGACIVESLTIGFVSGIIVATLSFFAVNRMLPPGSRLLGQDRAALEVWTFCLVWAGTFAHAALRPRHAWAEQCWAITVLAGSAVLLNWITTSDHLWRSLSHRHLWPIAVMDLLLLLTATVAAGTARRSRWRSS